MGWQVDLPSPFDPPAVQPSMGYDSPNFLNEIYLEFPRASNRKRGVVVWLVLALLGAYIHFTYENEFSSSTEIGLIAIWCGATLFALLSAYTLFRNDVSFPRDEPIRFNRARQRIYAYNFRFRWWNPFERWHVEAVAYDWCQVRAESWRLRGATAQGGMISTWGVMLSIIEPSTNEVIDRFPLTTMGADEFAWAYICTYMQQGPEALPIPAPPHDHNAVPWYNLALRFAPAVRWPEDMDLESRTAP